MTAATRWIFAAKLGSVSSVSITNCKCRLAGSGCGTNITRRTSTVILDQQLSPALDRSECCLPKRGRRAVFVFEGSRQLGNGEPRCLMGVFNFGAMLSSVGDLIDQVPNHYRRGFTARQARLANYQQRVIGFRKIGVVAHRSLCRWLRTTILARITAFHRICDPDVLARDVTGMTMPHRYRQHQQ